VKGVSSELCANGDGAGDRDSSRRERFHRTSTPRIAVLAEDLIASGEPRERSSATFEEVSEHLGIA